MTICKLQIIFQIYSIICKLQIIFQIYSIICKLQIIFQIYNIICKLQIIFQIKNIICNLQITACFRDWSSKDDFQIIFFQIALFFRERASRASSNIIWK